MYFINLIRFILNFFDNFQQKKIINFFKKKLNTDLIIIDVGSHYGETVKLFFKNFKVKKVHCFEASPNNYEILSKNIKRAGLNDFCSLNMLALGSSKMESYINQTKESSSSTINDFNTNSKYFKRKLKILNISNTDQYYKKIPIKIIILDEYIKEKKLQNIDLLKIDTEGFEFDVIQGLKKNYNIIKFIYFEHHYDDMIIKDYKFGDIHQLLKSYGFKMLKKSKMLFRKSFEYVYENQKMINNLE